MVSGHLYGWSKNLSATKRRGILEKAIKKSSYATIVRRLNQLRNVTKDQSTKKVAQSDMIYLKKKYRPDTN